MIASQGFSRERIVSRLCRPRRRHSLHARALRRPLEPTIEVKQRLGFCQRRGSRITGPGLMQRQHRSGSIIAAYPGQLGLVGQCRCDTAKRFEAADDEIEKGHRDALEFRALRRSSNKGHARAVLDREALLRQRCELNPSPTRCIRALPFVASMGPAVIQQWQHSQ